MIRNRARNSNTYHYLPKCPKYPPQPMQFDLLGQFSRLKRLITTLLIGLLVITIILGMPRNSEWIKTFGGERMDIAYSLIQTADGGYALAGVTESFSPPLECEFWLVKTDARGQVEWTKTFGYPAWAEAHSLIQTADGGYALAGSVGEDWSVPKDIWLVKIDAYGQAEWNQTFGGAGMEEAYSLIQTADGGYALAGVNKSFEVDDCGNWEVKTSDFWLVKTDAHGQAEWNQTFGGAGLEEAHSVIQTTDGGYALAGVNKSFKYDDCDFWGEVKTSDFWLVKTNAHGQAEWNQTFGGAGLEEAHSVIQTVDGGYVLAGTTESFFDAHDSDFWLVKTDAHGQTEWTKTFGRAGGGIAYSLIQTADSGYALAGSVGGDWGVPKDIWLVKTDAHGQAEWTKTFGGAGGGIAYSLIQTADGGYALAGAGGPDYFPDFLLIKISS